MSDFSNEEERGSDHDNGHSEDHDNPFINEIQGHVSRGPSLATELGISSHKTDDTVKDRESDDDSDSSINDMFPIGVTEANEEGWTGVLDNESGPSRRRLRPPFLSRQATQLTVTPRTENQQAESYSSSVFAERFKYLICSSGLLEKDYVPGLSSGPSIDPTMGSSDVRAANDNDDDFVSTVQSREEGVALQNAEWTSWRVDELRNNYEWLRKRWDLVAAFATLSSGIVVLVGVKPTATIIAVLLCLFWNKVHHRLVRIPVKPPDPKRSPSGTNAGPPSSKLPTQRPKQIPQAKAIESLEDLLAESRLLDSTIDSSLVLLQPHPESISTFQPLRLALHRLTDSMTDHLASATSILLKLVDKDEMAVLGEMYDIPVVGSFFYSRKKRRNESEDNDHDDQDEEEMENLKSISAESTISRRSGGIPSPRRDRPFSASFTANNQHRPNVPRAREPTAGDDKFTSLPPRTPRVSKRSSRTDLLVNAVGQDATVKRQTMDMNQGGEASSSSDSNGSSSWSRISHPHSHLYSPSKDQRSSFTPRKISPLSPRSKALSTLTSGHPYPKPLKEVAINILQPSPFSADSTTSSTALSRVRNQSSPIPEAKRRSLQNITYYRSDHSPLTPSPRQQALISESEGSGLYRTRSMGSAPENSHHRRSRLSHGSFPVSSSISQSYPVGLGLGFRKPRRDSMKSIRDPISPMSRSSSTMSHSTSWLQYPISRQRDSSEMMNMSRPARVISISPLTLQALKAACLGIHLKRRRMVTCLLGLRFGSSNGGQDEPDVTASTYWNDVGEAIKDLTKAVVEERQKLEGVKDEVDLEVKTTEELDRLIDLRGVSPEWDAVPPSKSDEGVRDYAPRRRDQDALLDEIASLQQSLVQSWKYLKQAGDRLKPVNDIGRLGSRDRTEGNDNGGLEEWYKLREQLGGMLRSWEKGRAIIESLSTMNESQPKPISISTELEGTEIVPEFLKSWTTTEEDKGVEGDLDTSSSTIETEHSTDMDDMRNALFKIGSTSQSLTETLPPPGVDVVHEADLSLEVAVVPKSSSGLTREERIRLVKEARSKNLPMAGFQGMDRTMSEPGEDGKVLEDRRESGKVVEELRGVIGIIRRRKDGVSTSIDTEEKASAVAIPAGTTDDGNSVRGVLSRGIAPSTSQQRGKELSVNIGDGGTKTSETKEKSVATIGSARSEDTPIDSTDSTEWRSDFVFPASWRSSPSSSSSG